MGPKVPALMVLYSRLTYGVFPDIIIADFSAGIGNGYRFGFCSDCAG